MKCLIFNIASFLQELKGVCMKDEVGQLIIQHKLVISEIAPCEISFYFPLPKELRNQVKGFINNQNEGNQCFRWCLFRYLYPAIRKPSKN